MKKFTKKLAVMLVLAMIVGMFSGAMGASAASAWSFKTGKDVEIAVKETISMAKNEYQDFDLYKNDVEIAEDDDNYTVTWKSSDETVVWVNAKTGQARADKGGAMTAATGEATITAVIENKTNGAKAERYFKVQVGEIEVAELVVEFADGTDATQALEVGTEYAIKNSTLDADGNALSFKQTGLYRKYFCDGLEIVGGKFTPAKGGTYTITCAAFDSKEAMEAATDATAAVITGTLEVTVAVDAPEFVKAFQTNLNTVELTLNDAEWAAAIVADPSLLAAYQVMNGFEITTYAKSVAAKADAADVVVVTLYNNLASDATYKFAYVGTEATISLVGAGTAPAAIEVVSGNATVTTMTDLNVKFYNSIGTDITTDALKALVVYTADESTDYYVAGSQIYFFEAGKTAVVKATFDMGLDDEGNEKTDLIATGIMNSVAAATGSVSGINGYAIAADGTVDFTNVAFGDTVSKLAMGDAGKAIFAKYTTTDPSGNATQVYIKDGTDGVDANYTYYSTNETILLVEQTTGTLYPVAQGNTSVYIKKGDNVVGYVAITVGGARTLTTFTAAPAKAAISTVDATIDVNLTAKDQYGEAIATNYTYELTYPTGSTLTTYFETPTPGDGKVTFTPKAAAINDGAVQVFKIKVIATSGTVVKNQIVSFSVKDVTGVSAASNALTLSTNSLDLKLNQDALAKYDVTFKILSKDAAGYNLGEVEFVTIGAAGEALTDAGEYSLLITAPNGTALTEYDDEADPVNVYTFNGVTGTTALTKAATGNYTAKLYKGNGTAAQLVQIAYLTVVDSTVAATATVNNTTIDSNTAGDVLTALKIFRGTTDITAKTTAGSVDCSAVVNGNQVYIYSITVSIDAGEMNAALAGKTTTETITINKLFTIG